jgi:hypothetical protein
MVFTVHHLAKRRAPVHTGIVATVPRLKKIVDDDEPASLQNVFDRRAPAPTEVVTLDTGEHGTEILDYADASVADRFRQAVLDFTCALLSPRAATPRRGYATDISTRADRSIMPRRRVPTGGHHSSALLPFGPQRLDPASLVHHERSVPDVACATVLVDDPRLST